MTDNFTGEARLCDDDGTVRSGPFYIGVPYVCTGSAHFSADDHVRCTSPAHDQREQDWMFRLFNVDAPAALTWTVTAAPASATAADIRRSIEAAKAKVQQMTYQVCPPNDQHVVHPLDYEHGGLAPCGNCGCAVYLGPEIPPEHRGHDVTFSVNAVPFCHTCRTPFGSLTRLQVKRTDDAGPAATTGP